MATITTNSVEFSWQISTLVEKLLMLSAYNTKLLALEGDSSFIHKTISLSDISFIEESMEHALDNIAMLGQYSMLEVEKSIGDTVCKVTMSSDMSLNLNQNSVDILESVIGQYITLYTLGEWAATTANAPLVSSCNSSTESLYRSIDKSLLWVTQNPGKRSYSLSFN